MARSITKLAVSLIVLASSFGAAAQAAVDATEPIVNPAIDPAAFLRVAGAALAEREHRRISEEEFVRMSREPGTVVLDARSKEKFDELHVEGALHLSFPDIALDSLAALLPDRNIRILIYCNNNFRGAESPFPKKLASASLNLSTFVALYDYGYRNVWELGPLIDVETTTIPFARSETTAL
ncbi:MAG TPA: rhodanese-like domain-containing protein [Caldimonas sp.]|nr:rhodanese-like domain-containing protein [Caldimonas sp.]